jgi:Uma2 family endonuclease
VSPQGQHGWLQGKLAELFIHFAEPLRLARAFTETRVTFDGASLVPDVVVYRWDRIPRTRAGEVANRFTQPPDIAIEIVSPDQSVAEQTERCWWYLAHGVEIALLVNPEERTVVRFGSDGTESTLLGADRVDLDAVLPGFHLTVQALFGTLRVD